MQGWTWEEDNKADALTEEDKGTMEHVMGGESSTNLNHTVLLMPSANGLGWGVVSSSTRCELKSLSVSETR